MDFTNLTNNEFVEMLNKNGFNITSINNAQRSLYEKRLNKKFQTQSVDLQDKTNLTAEPNLCKESTKQCNAIIKYDGPFYAVQIPNANLSEASLIFTDCLQANKFCKEHSNARFKVFKNLEDAKNFVKHSCPEPIKDNKELSMEGSSFPSIKYEDIFKMKRKIEEGCISDVKENLYQNPRYLISSGDTPTIYQEGSRYNALHLASFKNQPDMCSLIITTLSDSLFLNLMYPNDSQFMLEQRKNNILDLYLNMPDKSLNETPLHFASKFGFVEIIKILVTHPFTEKLLKNKYNETPMDIICSRMKNPKEKIKEAAKNAFEGDFYTVILRNEDEPATLSSVISSQDLANLSPPPLKTSVPQFDSPYSNKSQNIISTSFKFDSPIKNNSPLRSSNMENAYLENNVTPVRNNTPERNTPNEKHRSISNTKHVAAIIGPSPRHKMELLHKLIVSCGRTVDEKRKYSSTKRSDSRKGIERVCREIAHKENVNWSEFWDFLGCHINLSSIDGLTLFEDHLQSHRENKLSRIRNDSSNNLANSFIKSSASHKSTSQPNNIDVVAQENDDVIKRHNHSTKNRTPINEHKIKNKQTEYNELNLDTMKHQDSEKNFGKNLNLRLLNSNTEITRQSKTNAYNGPDNFIINHENGDSLNLKDLNSDSQNSSLGDLCQLLDELSILSKSPKNNSENNSKIIQQIEDHTTNKLNDDDNDDKNSNNDDNDDDFITAAETTSETKDTEDFEEEENYFDSSDILYDEMETFINGEEAATIFDAEAFLALEFLDENNLVSFPNVYTWFNKMKTFNLQEIKRRPNKSTEMFSSNNKMNFSFRSQLFPIVSANILDFNSDELL